jgi:hypothetical protein
MVQITPSLVFDCSSQPAADAAIEHLLSDIWAIFMPNKKYRI